MKEKIDLLIKKSWVYHKYITKPFKAWWGAVAGYL